MRERERERERERKRERETIVKLTLRGGEIMTKSNIMYIYISNILNLLILSILNFS